MHARSNAARAATMSSTPVPVPDSGAPHDDDEGAPLTLLADLQDDCPGATIVPAGSLSKRRKSGAGYESATDNNVHFDSFRVKSGPDVLRVVDSLLALHVIAPLVISCWRGLWELFGLFPDVYPPWAQAVFGSVLHTLLALTRDVFMRTFDCRRYPEPGRSLIKVLTRCYTWVFATACISHWRGTWFLLDMLGVDATKVVLIWALAALLMLGTRSLRNTMAPPLVVGSDGPDFCFTFTHMFRSDVSTKDRQWRA
ncbi:uncharacterized protein LOC127751640 [Frankliniella occidentalis]|uniref:Uncharacterized protein LOC127751640 n=1 Tax=Frankliniella occidentalis TaxID=133901 RepID=A0A9C6X905_FRAOC|nr:uncharacterized protein LOC127751640 [Frankliniella occidentalis]